MFGGKFWRAHPSNIQSMYLVLFDSFNGYDELIHALLWTEGTYHSGKIGPNVVREDVPLNVDVYVNIDASLSTVDCDHLCGRGMLVRANIPRCKILT